MKLLTILRGNMTPFFLSKKINRKGQLFLEKINNVKREI